jgi:hypothetical protein
MSRLADTVGLDLSTTAAVGFFSKTGTSFFKAVAVGVFGGEGSTIFLEITKNLHKLLQIFLINGYFFATLPF